MERKQQQQQEAPYLFDLTQDDEESYDVTATSVDKFSISKQTCFETGNNNNRLQLKKCAITLDSDASSDCVLVLSPEIDPKQISNINNTLVKAYTNSERNLSEDDEPKTSVARRQCDDDADSDDDLWLQRPAFASSVTGSNGAGYSSYIQDTKVAYSDSGNNSKGCVTAISSSSAITTESSKAEAKERRQQLRDAEKQQKALEKESARIQQAYEKEQKLIERERLKRQREVEKQQKQQDRKKLQQEKQQLKEQEKLERQQCLLEDQQEQGKFAQQEICIHLEKSLAQSVLGGLIQMTLSDTYMVSSPNSSSPSECVVDATTTADTSSEISNKSLTLTKLVPPIVDGCVQWSRRDYILGGATTSYDPTSEDGVEWLDILAVVFYDPKVFLRLLTREILGVSEEEGEDFEDDFPLLRAWVKQLRESYARARLGVGRANSSSVAVVKPPRIVLILHKVQEEMSQQWVKNNGRKKRRKSFIPANEDELHDAVIWMLIEERIECAFTSTDLETIDYLKGLTRALSEYPYAELMTELQCIKKLKSTHSTIESSESSKNGGGKSPYDRAKDSWLRMLQQIKGLTEGMALRVVRYYPTARSLMERYEDPHLTVDQKRTLLATLLMDGKRNMVKLSDSVYRLMTSEDPFELIL